MMGNKPTNNYIPRSHSRRRGQALLLAVLMMVFIVLLGTTFIAIVSSNLNQTARTASKDQARLAAQAGIEFADQQLSGSIAGLNWRPQLVNTLPAPGNAAYSFYWSAQDRAQGWNEPSATYVFYDPDTGAEIDAQFVKFPNPLQISSTGNASHFMIRVSVVRPGDPDNSTGSALNTKTGDIRIESVGFANDDPAAFYRMVAYKKGPRSLPLTAAMRSVSNWDFENDTVPMGRIESGNTSSLVIRATNLQGSFNVGDYVTVWDPNQSTIGYGTISGVSLGNWATLSFATPLTNLSSPISAGSIVQKAASLGIPASFAIDYDNDATTTNQSIDFRISGLNDLAGNTINTPGSVWVNGGLMWYGQNFATNLVASSAATAANPASFIQTSGVFGVVGGQVQATGTGVGTPTAIPASSADAGYTGNAVVTNGLLKDGLNRLRGSLEDTRQVEPFTPPDITAGGNGYGRYRQLTLYSPSMYPADPQASAYGYGQGIYINNPDDVEKVGNKAMSQEQLHKLWFEEATADYGRTAEPATATADNKSLEEQHLRGWVSPDQFLPRGAKVVLNNDSTITITLDSRLDNDSGTCGTNPPDPAATPADPPLCNSMGGVEAKGWRGLNGGLLGGDKGGVYRQTLPWPANGTLFAEGNIRIQGQVADAPRSLTVVSMNNIYIDGSLSADADGDGTEKVLLLAKSNVIVNPSQVLQVMDDQTRLSADIPVGTNFTSITVYDAAGWRAGDLIEVNGLSGNDMQLRISAAPSGDPINGYTVPVVQASTTSASYIQDLPVHIVADPGLDATGADEGKPYTEAIRLSRFTHAIQRRVQLPTAAGDLRLAFRHSAEYRQALTVTTVQAVSTPADPEPLLVSAELANKLVTTSPESIIQAADKTLTVEYVENPPTTPSPATDTFLQTPPVDQATAAATTLQDLADAMVALRTAQKWHYDVTVEHEYGTATKQAPYYFMASVGNRYKHGVLPPGPGLPERQNIFVPETYTIPMATSVWLTMNGIPVQLQDNHWNNSLGAFGLVNQFGFNPLFMDTATPENAYEDVLTSDQYFYQPNTGTPASDEQPAVSANYADQEDYDVTNVNYTLDSRRIVTSASVAGKNDIAIQLNDAEVDPVAGHRVDYYFYTPGSTTDASIPFYRLSNLKLQNETMDATSHEMNAMAPGANILIDAYVYAQEGGWYVIPGSEFDEDVKNGNDLNRDGVISPAEDVAAYRFHLYNYQIVFTGAIMENQTASIDDVDKWTNKWATVQTAVPNVSPTYDSANPAASNFNTILYYYDPEAAQGLVVDGGFHAPTSPGVGLIYQG